LRGSKKGIIHETCQGLDYPRDHPGLQHNVRSWRPSAP
jgi:hypothetical protein